jgi:hypothetical protein
VGNPQQGTGMAAREVEGAAIELATTVHFPPAHFLSSHKVQEMSAEKVHADV